MLRVIGCITQDHDPGLLVLAALICAVAANTTVRFLNPKQAGSFGRDQIRLAAGSVAFGGGVWTTHFVALLAFHPATAIGYDVALCSLSFVIAFIGAGTALSISGLPGSRADAPLAGGVVLASGIAIMHFAGTRALQWPGTIQYNINFVLISLVLGGVYSVAAIVSLKHRRWIQASVLLTVAVLSIHLVGMASMTLDVASTLPASSPGMTRNSLGIVVGGGGLLLLGLATAASIVENRMLRHRLQDARRLRILADATFEGLIIERNGIITDVNRAMCALAECAANALIGLQLTDLIPDVEPTERMRDHPMQQVMLLPNDRFRTIEVLWRDNLDGDGHVIAVRDLSRQKEVELQIATLVHYDLLTGLPNRAHFVELMNKALVESSQGGHPIALLHVHLARHDIVSETLGPWIGERAEVHAARRLSTLLREVDTIAKVARAEFAILRVLDDPSADSMALAARIAEEIGAPLTIDEHTIDLAANVGIALYPQDCVEGDELLRSAALALHQAKLLGPGKCCQFDYAMDIMIRTKRLLERDMRLALSTGQFSLNYQPFVKVDSREIVGYEALLRWHHPERGWITPDDFIPIAEQCGLIIPIGAWVLTTACAAAASWPNQAIVSVNLSPAQFVEPGIIPTIEEVLRTTGLPPTRLELEITEGVLMEDTENALQTLKGLKALGVRIAMDDFGTGYSSLGYLRKFPFDKIKIDRSFISDMDSDLEAETIVQAIIVMGFALKLAVTVEGVETERQLRTLHAHGCAYAQGFLLGRPCSASELARQMSRKSPLSSQDSLSLRPVPASPPFVWQD